MVTVLPRLSVTLISNFTFVYLIVEGNFPLSYIIYLTRLKSSHSYILYTLQSYQCYCNKYYRHFTFDMYLLRAYIYASLHAVVQPKMVMHLSSASPRGGGGGGDTGLMWGLLIVYLKVLVFPHLWKIFF